MFCNLRQQKIGALSDFSSSEGAPIGFAAEFPAPYCAGCGMSMS
jgi:hypothetical protein